MPAKKNVQWGKSTAKWHRKKSSGPSWVPLSALADKPRRKAPKKKR